ncbi:MAG: hypothetical protein ABIQ18_50640 [Umezawaea sp.]
MIMHPTAAKTLRRGRIARRLVQVLATTAAIAGAAVRTAAPASAAQTCTGAKDSNTVTKRFRSGQIVGNWP